MTKRFLKRFKDATTFDSWLETLAQFNYSLVKENGLQLWTKNDFLNYWNQNKGC